MPPGKIDRATRRSNPPFTGRLQVERIVYVSLFISAAVLLLTTAAMGQPVYLEKFIYSRPQPAMTEPKGQVAELIGVLSDESSEKRRTAAQALLKMGPAVEPQLQWARQHGENEGRPLSWDMHHVREGNKWLSDARYLQPWHAENELDVLITHLQEQRRSRTSIITLHHTDALLTNVLWDLGRQADTDIAVGNFLPSLDWVNTNRVTVNMDRANFWEALQALQQSTELNPIHVNGQNRLIFRKGPPNDFANVVGTVISGAIRIMPMWEKRKRPRDNDAGRETAEVTLALAAFAEPKLSETRSHAMVRIDECVDDQSQSLIAGGKRTFASVESNDTWVWTVPLDLGPLGPGRRITMLKGQFSVGIGLTDRYMTITNLIEAQGKSREFDGLKAMVKQMSMTGSQYQVDVEMSAPKDSPFTKTFSASSELEVYIWQESTQTIVSQSVFRGVRDEAERTVGSWSLITPENGPRPATLIWKTPTETRWHTVPFEMRDLAVP